jgi:hypothetical protein
VYTLQGQNGYTKLVTPCKCDCLHGTVYIVFFTLHRAYHAPCTVPRCTRLHLQGQKGFAPCQDVHGYIFKVKRALHRAKKYTVTLARSKGLCCTEVPSRHTKDSLTRLAPLP